jgi:hypothetical protein
MPIGGEFLRSINLAADLAHSERLAHYRPTTESLRVIEAVAWGRPGAATMVIAAYGSGKSLAAGIGALLVRNRPQDWATTGTALDRLTAVDAKAAARMQRRHGSARRGLVIALHGHVPDLPAALVAPRASGRPRPKALPKPLLRSLRLPANTGRTGSPSSGTSSAVISMVWSPTAPARICSLCRSSPSGRFARPRPTPP